MNVQNENVQLNANSGSDNNMPLSLPRKSFGFTKLIPRQHSIEEQELKNMLIAMQSNLMARGEKDHNLKVAGIPNQIQFVMPTTIGFQTLQAGWKNLPQSHPLVKQVVGLHFPKQHFHWEMDARDHRAYHLIKTATGKAVLTTLVKITDYECYMHSHWETENF
jgi:hypothetical protein